MVGKDHQALRLAHFVILWFINMKVKHNYTRLVHNKTLRLIIWRPRRVKVFAKSKVVDLLVGPKTFDTLLELSV